MNFRYGILHHAKLQLPSTIIVDVMADGVISRVGWLLPSYEAWCSASEGSCAVKCSALFFGKIVVYLKNFKVLSLSQ